MRTILPIALCCLTVGACGFEDPTPSDIFFAITGSEGAQVQLVTSTQFAAGVNELGVTEVTLLHADTVTRTLPVDTVVSVRIDHRFFIEVLPLEGDSLPVRVEVDVDDRRLYGRSGLVVRESPFRYVYVFNQPLTEIVDVVL
ncbi:MAG: hypothetical protein PVI57_12325 [Gemmatimonadota bacterium]|jgi:hypothetical protein